MQIGNTAVATTVVTYEIPDFIVFAPHAIDFYKSGHPFMFPEHLQELYGNVTPRSAKYAVRLPDFDGHYVWFGGQAAWAKIHHSWKKTFFDAPKAEAIARYKERMDTSLGVGKVPTWRLEALHDLGYLPLHVKTLPEGARVPFRVTPMTMKSTIEEFAWVEQYLETQISNAIWRMVTSATTQFEYKRLGIKYADLTGVDRSFVDFQFHNFADRGMSFMDDAAYSGAAALISSKGTDSVSAIDVLEQIYPDSARSFIGGSIPATEHAVSSSNIAVIVDDLQRTGFFSGWSTSDLTPRPGAGMLEIGETGFMKHMLKNLYPTGMFSYVADTYDFWAVISVVAKFLKNDIMSRDGKIVFRPDSGDPYHILCGYKVDTVDTLSGESEAVLWDDGVVYTVKPTEENRVGYTKDKPLTDVEVKGAVQVLWEIFGGSVNLKGFKELDPHVGLIYGDSITLNLAQKILQRLFEMGFASNCAVFGVGSFTFAYTTRDSLGLAAKATFSRVADRDLELFKDPKTDSGLKKSARGFIRVEYEEIAKGVFDYVQYDQQTREQEQQGELQSAYLNGAFTKRHSYSEVRFLLNMALPELPLAA